jgi:hypothetical protein
MQIAHRRQVVHQVNRQAPLEQLLPPRLDDFLAAETDAAAARDVILTSLWNFVVMWDWLEKPQAAAISNLARDRVTEDKRITCGLTRRVCNLT